jgi:WD40 repeat protein
MGIVYKANQLSHQRLVALKVIRKDRLLNPEVVRRFRREAQAALRLSHPNIVLIYDYDPAGDTHYLAMEYVDGVTLQELVEQQGRLPIPLACDYIRQAALGLQHAFEQALVHRDIKPSNLMITRPNAARLGAPSLLKILDMGVARLYQLSHSPEESITTLTQDGSVIGTPDYIAPEQLENPHGADIRADLYSLGCTFYYLLTGQVPFPGGTLIQKLDRQRWQTPADVNQLRPEVPEPVVAVVRKLLAKHPGDRFQMPADLASTLETLTRTGHLPGRPRSATVRELRRLTGHTEGVLALALAPSGQQVLSAGKDRTVRYWEVETGKELSRFADYRDEVRALAFAPDGQCALSAVGVSVRLWEVSTGKELQRFRGHSDAVRSVAFTPDGRRALSAGEDRTVRVWDLQTGRELLRFSKHGGGVNCLAVSPDGRQVLTGSRDQSLRLWDVQHGQEQRRITAHKGQVLSVAFSADGRQALSGHFDTIMRLWEVTSGRELRRFQGHKQMVTGVGFVSAGRGALSASHDQTLRLWDLDSGSELASFEGHTAAVTCLALALDGRWAISGSADKTLCVWQIPE